jgi:hypothetical protein
VADIHYDRYRSNCTNCGKVEYPLDTALGLRPRQQFSSSVQELSVLCGASWKYTEAEYMMQKILRRRCVCHETILNKTTEVGKAASLESEGARIKELEDDKKLQGRYFDNMEVWKDPPVLIYTDLDGVMINCRDGTKRMEGKVAVVWSSRELVKADTYSLTDKRVMGTFTDTERFYWEITGEVYKRSGGRMDEVDTLRKVYAPRSRYLLDHHHLCEKVIDLHSMTKKSACQAYMKTREEAVKAVIASWIFWIQMMLMERNREGIWYKEARAKGISIGSGSVDKD